MVDESRFLALVAEVQSRAPLAHSPEHGTHHWRLVAWTGAELLPTVGGADDLVVLLFALFHDSQRVTDYVDPEHGPRGAQLARELVPRFLPELPQPRLDVLAQACELHTAAVPTNHATLGTCWDSDRLNLWRVGIEPSPRYLSTEEASRPKRIEWAYRLQEEDLSWQEVLSKYLADDRSDGVRPPVGDE